MSTHVSLRRTDVALPSTEEDLGLSAQGLQWVVSAYALTVAGLCGLAWSDQALIGARAFQGIGAAIMTPTALSIVTTIFEEGSKSYRG